ncbi:uncharacterized protein PFL1_02429 [Pseudozyma flocculosa PF-1]|uniref:Uncharacterized protein n=1 Tax=Pseudozyma flocculosa TaxID=84751 RepID=A0A5C3F5H1_9BASI|nr:uncharacterized protein PFL1_02429 [Pseudozyma flocculosa PF-1]EPQ30314.1 hypothetical protein PFL1_02429 [Pseudozyma flocculosa PF-1]SPO39744.1 uncharacterized protein PSFLO_05225 [Pseudozyma flocculosa]
MTLPHVPAAAATASHSSSNGDSHSTRSGTPQPAPRASGSYYVRSTDPSLESLMTWVYIQSTVASGDLDDLFRAQRCEDEYRQWAVPIRKKWGGLEAYIRDVRLGWRPQQQVVDESDSLDADQKVRLRETWPQAEMPHPDGSGTILRHFIDDPRLADPGASDDGEAVVKCIPNDWPYAVPDDVEHWVVWSKLPILHASLFSDPATPFPAATIPSVYSCVLNDGVRGCTGTSTELGAPRVYGNLTKRSTSLHLRNSAEAAVGTGEPSGGPDGVTLDQSAEGQRWASREISRFVRRMWAEERYETVFFCNPPHLRTVPGLSHFHVFVRPKVDRPAA